MLKLFLHSTAKNALNSTIFFAVRFSAHFPFARITEESSWNWIKTFSGTLVKTRKFPGTSPGKLESLGTSRRKWDSPGF